MYQSHTDDLQFMVSEVGRNHVRLAMNPFYRWLLKQERCVERTNALAFMWRNAFISKLNTLHVICSTVMNRPMPISFRKRMMNEEDSIKYNHTSSIWISKYIQGNIAHICDYIDAGTAFLK